MTTTTHAEFNDKTEGTEVAKAFAETIRGKTILVTGVNRGGIGFTTAEAFVCAISIHMSLRSLALANIVSYVRPPNPPPTSSSLAAVNPNCRRASTHSAPNSPPWTTVLSNSISQASKPSELPLPTSFPGPTCQQLTSLSTVRA